MSEMNWDTNETLDWWLNDERYYNMPYSTFSRCFREENGGRVDLRKVKWGQVKTFINEERAGR